MAGYEEDYSYRFYIDSLGEQEQEEQEQEEQEQEEQEEQEEESVMDPALYKRYLLWLEEESFRRELLDHEIEFIEILRINQLEDDREDPEERPEYDPEDN